MAGQTISISVLADSKKFTQAMSGIANKAGSTFSTIGKVAGVGLLAAGAAIIGLTKSVVSGTGEWEQAAGGVEAVFGKIAPAVMKASESAFKMGMSSTEFMANQAKLGSLMQANGLSVSEAWNNSSTVMTRAADMASVMGVSTGEATQAIVGMAKGNYEMMDNLGVKMDATTLKAYAAQKGLDFTSAADKSAVAMAYFLDKTNQYAGNAAQEAQRTIQGSIGMLKSSWSDLIAGMGQSDSNMTQLITNVSDSIKAVVSNITPVVQQVLTTLPAIFAMLIPLVLALVPDLLTAGTQMISALITGVVTALPGLISTVVPMILTFVTTLVAQLPTIIDAGIEVLLALIYGVVESIPQLVPVAIDAIMKIIDTLLDNLPAIIDAGITLIVTLALALINALPKLAQKVPQIIIKIVTTLIANIDKIIDAGVTLLLAIVENMPAILKGLVGAIPQIITAIVNALVKAAPKIADAGGRLVEGLWKGISDGYGWIKGKIEGWVGNVLDFIKRLFGIKSPSTVMAGYGDYLVQGLANGITDNVGTVTKAMSSLNKAVTGSFDNNLALDTVRAGGTVHQYFIDGVQLDLTSEEGEQFKQLMTKMNRQIKAGV